MNKIVTGAMTVVALCLWSAAEAQIYIPPQCEIDTGHFLVNQAELYVKAASEARDDERRQQAMDDARRVLDDALARDEVANPGVWYFLGRLYGLEEDYLGADSAFARAESLLSECADDIDTQRYSLWVPVYNQAVEQLRADDWAGAKPNLIKANAIYHEEPFVPYYLASIYAQDGVRDSAITFFKETVALLGDSPDTTYQETYDISVFNVARLFHQQQAWDSAAAWYATYRQVHPEDITALQGMAGVYELAGRTDEAAEAYDELLARADEVDALTLFGVGVSLFQMDLYERAAQAFQAGLDQNPYHRDGLYNLAQSFYALATPSTDEGVEPTPEQLAEQTRWATEMLEAAQNLVEVDFQNASSLEILAQAWQILGEDDSTLAVVERLSTMPFDITITMFRSTPDGFEIEGYIENRQPEDVVVPPVRFDFVNGNGDTVISDTFEGRTLAPQGTAEFYFSPLGEGIVAWIYHVTGETESG